MEKGSKRASADHSAASSENSDGKLVDRLFLADDELPVEVTEDHIRSILCVRRGREATLGRHLFSDPAWDILLELYAARLGTRTMTVEEVARSIDVPTSTTARWITVLTESHLVEATTNVSSSTDMHVAISKDGERAMKRLVDYWGAAFRSI